MNLDRILRTCFEVTPMALGIRSLDGDDIVHVYDNPASAELFGLTPADLADKRATELGVDCALLPAVIEKMQTALRTGSMTRVEFEYETPAGHRHFVKRLAAIPGQVDDAGRELFLAVVEDVTELRALQAGLQRADRLSTLGTLTAAVGHEVASPLVVVSANITTAQQLVRRGEIADPLGKLSPRLAEAHEACAHLTRVLTTLREFGRGTDRDRTVRLGEAIQRATTLAGAAVRHAVALTVATEPDPVVQGGIVSITQIVLNLLTNAARAATQHHPDGGARVEIRTGVDGRDAFVEVVDNGAGVPPSVRDHLFEPFVTGHADSGGTGLGLYVARRMAEAIGGRLSLTSTATGTTGRLDLQVAG
ncbi:MAG TPA: ATP-binding protein [Kofleriaceae bacterium]|jgi:PAS domain S-box-containing protein|nr:ATP-binding protein [Kofleriaceae bacterium]